MTRIKNAWMGYLLVMSALWLAADTLLPTPLNYFSFRTVFMQYSGVIAMSAMSLSMILALRLAWVENLISGLDKAYRLHKWLGITALVSSLLHWWWAKGTKWMVGWGWLERPHRGPRPMGVDLSSLEQFFRSQRHFAESVGEWAFYAALVLMVLALVKQFPYHWFQKTHKFIAAAYLALAFHTFVLLKFEYWSQPIGWVMAILVLGGVYSAVLTLIGKIGATRKVEGKISSTEYSPALGTLQTEIELNPGWPGHAAGQFAFVTSDPSEGAHPYTIASAWSKENPRITFVTKSLGDHTSTLHEKFTVGLPVTVEGPYGRFTFLDDQPRQIWVGAGIGITPFIARMKELATRPWSKPIDLFHTTSVVDTSMIERLKADAKKAGITLHIIDSAKNGRLSGEHIRAEVPEWQEASLWFCGPIEFGDALRKDFAQHGAPAKHFHQELFHMR